MNVHISLVHIILGLQWVLSCTENSYVDVFEVLMSVSWLTVTCYISYPYSQSLVFVDSRYIVRIAYQPRVAHQYTCICCSSQHCQLWLWS